MKSNYKRLGDYIVPCDEKNTGNIIKKLQGISNQKYFQKSHTNTIGVDLEKYRIVRNGQFAFNRATTRNGEKISIALRQGKDCIVSPSYRIFKSKDENILNSEYLMMWFKRPEFDRFARFKSHGSAHEFFDYGEMCEVELPIPSIEKQQEIVREYNIIQNRIALNNQLISKLEETAQAIYKQWFVEFEFPDENGKPYKSNGGKMVWCEELEKEIPEGWKVSNLQELTSFLSRGITPKYTESKGIIVINQKCIRSNAVDLTLSRKHNLDLKKVPEGKILIKHDILVNSTGTGTLGRVGLVKNANKKMTVDTHITIVRPSAKTKPLYLWFAISGRTSDIEYLAEGSTGQTELSRENLGGMQVVLPSFDVQNKFSSIVENCINLSLSLESEILLLKDLKDLILAKMTKI